MTLDSRVRNPKPVPKLKRIPLMLEKGTKNAAHFPKGPNYVPPLSKAQRAAFYEAKEQPALPSDLAADLIMGLEGLIQRVKPDRTIRKERHLELYTPERRVMLNTKPDGGIWTFEAIVVDDRKQPYRVDVGNYKSVTDWALSTLKPYEIRYHYNNMLDGTLLNDPLLSDEAKHLRNILTEIFEQHSHH